MFRCIKFCGLVIVFSLVLGTDCIRSMPVQADALREFRDRVVGLLTSSEAQKIELSILTFYLCLFIVFFLAKNIGTQSSAGAGLLRCEVIRLTLFVGFCLPTLLHGFLAPPNALSNADSIVVLSG